MYKRDEFESFTGVKSMRLYVYWGLMRLAGRYFNRDKYVNLNCVMVVSIYEYAAIAKPLAIPIRKDKKRKRNTTDP